MSTDVFVLGMNLILIKCVVQVAKLDANNFRVSGPEQKDKRDNLKG